MHPIYYRRREQFTSIDDKIERIMFLSEFHQESADGIHISAEQASRFAKEVAGDFNPIHDPDSKRFCVPGDLLFSLVLNKYGLSRQMCFTFSGMVGNGVALRFPDSDDEKIAITDGNGKTYLQVERKGEVIQQKDLVESFARQYVSFSGKNFPDILIPLVTAKNVMLNPDRPLVIYESMSVYLDRLDFAEPELKLSDSRIEVKGKRGDVRLNFEIESNGETVGTGFKKLVLGGLIEYQEERVRNMIDGYEQVKRSYKT